MQKKYVCVVANMGFKVEGVENRNPEKDDPYFDKLTYDQRMLKKEWVVKLQSMYPAIDAKWREWVLDLCLTLKEDEMEELKRKIEASSPIAAKGGCVYYGTDGTIEDER